MNGQVGFEFLLLYCQTQIFFLIFIYICSLLSVKEVLVELKEMEVLAIKDGGQIWDIEYD